MDTGRPAGADTTRERIVAAAARLLAEGGQEAVSTRGVSAAAGVQAPAIYRLFGDKQGLLDAVATHGFTSVPERQDRREGRAMTQSGTCGQARDLHISFALANPAVYSLMYGEPRPGAAPPPAAAAAAGILTTHIRRIAEARLRVGEERAAQLVHAAGSGTALSLIALPEDRRDLALSDLAREAVIAAITTGTAAPRTARPGRRRGRPAGPAAPGVRPDRARAGPAARVAGPHRQQLTGRPDPGSEVEDQVAARLGAADQRAAAGWLLHRVGAVADRPGQQGGLAGVAHAGAA